MRQPSTKKILEIISIEAARFLRGTYHLQPCHLFELVSEICAMAYARIFAVVFEQMFAIIIIAIRHCRWTAG